MSKTINHKGKTYEIGKYYLFGDTKDDVTRCRKLKTIMPDWDCPFLDERGIGFFFIKELPSSDNLGTIIDKPVELIDGAVYMFDFEDRDLIGLYEEDRDHIGFYEEDDYMFSMNGLSVSVESCTNIRKMEVVNND